MTSATPYGVILVATKCFLIKGQGIHTAKSLSRTSTHCCLTAVCEIVSCFLMHFYVFLFVDTIFHLSTLNKDQGWAQIRSRFFSSGVLFAMLTHFDHVHVASVKHMSKTCVTEY